MRLMPRCIERRLLYVFTTVAFRRRSTGGSYPSAREQTRVRFGFATSRWSVAHRRPVARCVLGAAIPVAVAVVVAEIPRFIGINQTTDADTVDELRALAVGAAGTTHAAGGNPSHPLSAKLSVRRAVAAARSAATLHLDSRSD
jgi:hypothetical protein